MLGQELGHDAGGNAGLGKLAVQVHARRHDGRLDRVEHIESCRHLAETVPVHTGLGFGGFAFDDPGVGAAYALVHQLVGAPHLEPPVVAVFFIDLAHGPAEIQRLGNAFLHQRGATGRLHHGGRHVAAGDDAVLRAGAGVHQIRIVEQVLVQLDGLRILHQHLAGLADAGQQFVNRLRGVDHGVFGARTFFSHGMVGAVKRVKRRVRQPGFIKVDVLHIAVQHAFDGFGVVQHAIVGGLRQRQHARLDFAGIHVVQMGANQGVGLDFFLDGGGFELAFGDRADDAKMIARGFQKHRDCPGHDDGVQDGHVAIAVNHHHVIGCDRVVPHHLVAGAGAIGHEKAVVRIEDTRRIALALANGAVMVQQLTELFHGIADVSAQHVFTIKLVVHLPHRTFQKGDAA